MTADLRGFLELLEKRRKSDLLRVEHEVSPRFETCAIVARLEEKRRSPLVYFEKVAGTRYPMVTNVCGSQGRVALALDCGLREAVERYDAAVDHLVAPSVVEDAPVHENVDTGEAVDLSRFPALVYHEHDADAPYITCAIVCAADPDTGVTNLSFHRLMVIDRNHTGIFIEKGKHLDGIFQKYVAAGRDMPIGVFIGAHPAWMLGALYSGSADVAEYDVIGGLLGEPLELVRGKTQDVLVPARAEIVLEGVVKHDVTTPEGPFGEFTGYGTGATMTPVFEVTAICERNDAIFQDVVSGHMEHLVLPMLAIESRAKRDAMAASKNVVGVALPAPFTLVVAMDKADDDEPQRVMDALLGADIYRKHVIVVDATVDPSDLRQVLGAMALSTQANVDVHLFEDALGTPLDPSCTNAEGRVTKMGIDATRRVVGAREVTKNTVPQDVWDRIDVNALLGRK
ncbi:MAG: UbiD family decarboxylase [Deltaproteobacteria bacterium]